MRYFVTVHTKSNDLTCLFDVKSFELDDKQITKLNKILDPKPKKVKIKPELDLNKV